MISTWFAPQISDLLGEPLERPVSVMSCQVIESLGLKLLDPDATYASWEDEVKEWGLFCWMHSEGLHEVKTALWNGSYVEILNGTLLNPEMEDELLPVIRADRAELQWLVSSADFDVRPKKRTRDGGERSTPMYEPRPSDAVDMDWFSLTVTTVMRELRLPNSDALWSLPFGEAMAVFHSFVRDNWTAWVVRKKTAMARSDRPESGGVNFEDFGKRFLPDEDEDDDAE